jgi:LAGLIDADG-like domain
MSPWVPRKKNAAGDALCEGCTNGREGRPLSRHAELTDPVDYDCLECGHWRGYHRYDDIPICTECETGQHHEFVGPIEHNAAKADRWFDGALIRAQAHMTPDAAGLLVKVAHGNMDGVTVFHCFSGETRYWTHDGLKTLEETAGTIQKVLTSSGKWVDAHIHSFGEQELMKVTLQRNKREKIIFATPEHRWIVRTGSPRHEGVTTTENLKPEHRLASRVPKSRIGQTSPSPFGIAHGFVYGDGTRPINQRGGRASSVNLWGDKDAQMLKYFDGNPMSPRKTDNGVLGTHVSCLPRFFKDLPSLEETTSYLYGWLAGYFAADGTVSKTGGVLMHSASQEDLKFVQLAAMRLGIATYDIVSRVRQGYGDEPSTLYSMQFVGSTLRSNFFLTKTHRERFDAAQDKDTFDRMGWTVVSVEKTDRYEEVFCAVVPGTESFVLDGLILTGNCPFCGSGQVVNMGTSIECGFCKTAFTVLVQPQFPMMPATVNGEPYTPGVQPGGGAAPTAPGGQAPPAAPGAKDDDDDEGSFGGDKLTDKVKKSDDDSGDDKPDEGKPDDSKPPDDSKDADAGDTKSNPFAKDSALALFVTAQGVALSNEQYMAHLALKFSPDRERTLTEVHTATEHRRPNRES